MGPHDDVVIHGKHARRILRRHAGRILRFGRIGDTPQIDDAVMHGDIEKPRPPRRPAQPRENLLADLGILTRLSYRGLDLKSR